MKKRKTKCKRCGQPISDLCLLRMCAPTEMNPDAMKREIPGATAIDEVPGK
jgi:hypothetical protein